MVRPRTGRRNSISATANTIPSISVTSSTRSTNGFEFDTSIRGNWNTGHEFSKEYSKDKEIKGVIGPALSPGDRKALIEYLKTL